MILLHCPELLDDIDILQLVREDDSACQIDGERKGYR